ncbi:hypothetical protein BAUCODRAFT_379481 [Baudoinia panamericana UAMH 10762]|uniref:COP9 signalosome complex subunit 6 n=1 Tax=Baudoinia panamericana (strain UAMH 10762) TaxID=717646 RepID=M2MPQ9_BAUPA|nr:uncharacterized protein BAUCODRAFT_379481 [Baudoinia panamericana UAMH 10762]EMC98746.1 hypothetical protein BAUCODRAFT_379481 [Baudoinia panamericana UAMH 10762]
MAGKEATANPLVITGKALDTSLSVQLHPLVLLTISDYITRHTLREQQGPIIGAIIGQQSGRQYTLEHAFECKLQEVSGNVLLDGEWFKDRLESYKEVHKAPALDLVAMFTLGPVAGPQDVHLPLLKQVAEINGSDSMMLLLFHAELVDQLQGGKLPISLYESVTEGEQSQVKFRELSFEVETGEAEMIGVDTVAKAGATASAVTKVEPVPAAESSKKEKVKGKGKAKEKDEEAASESVLSPEDDELIASLTAKVNAIRMLNQRINLIRSYLETLPSSYLTDASSSQPPPDTTNHVLLRSVNSMLSRIPLLAPPAPVLAPPTVNGWTTEAITAPDPSTTLQSAGIKERQDVHLTALLAALSRSVAEAQSMGSKFHIVSRDRESKNRNTSFGVRGGRGGFGGLGGEDSLLSENGGF